MHRQFGVEAAELSGGSAKQGWNTSVKTPGRKLSIAGRVNGHGWSLRATY
jgi:hypothetical protein